MIAHNKFKVKYLKFKFYDPDSDRDLNNKLEQFIQFINQERLGEIETTSKLNFEDEKHLLIQFKQDIPTFQIIKMLECQLRFDEWTITFVHQNLTTGLFTVELLGG